MRLKHSAAKDKPSVLLHKISHGGEGKAQCNSATESARGFIQYKWEIKRVGDIWPCRWV